MLHHRVTYAILALALICAIAATIVPQDDTAVDKAKITPVSQTFQEAEVLFPTISYPNEVASGKPSRGYIEVPKLRPQDSPVMLTVLPSGGPFQVIWGPSDRSFGGIDPCSTSSNCYYFELKTLGAGYTAEVRVTATSGYWYGISTAEVQVVPEERPRGNILGPIAG